MNWEKRSFSGKTLSPAPSCHISSDRKLLALITPWGLDNISPGNVFEELESEYNFFAEDSAKTYPFPRLVSLTETANNIRTSVIQVNNSIFHQANQEEYATGFELFYAVLHDKSCSFIQIGNPALLLDRKGRALQLIGQNAHWFWPSHVSDLQGGEVFDLLSPSNNQKQGVAPRQKKAAFRPVPPPPLPRSVLGLYPDISFHPVSFRFEAGDRLIFLNRQGVPPHWFRPRPTGQRVTLEHLSQLAIADNPEIPFWIGFVSLSADGHFCVS